MRIVDLYRQGVRKKSHSLQANKYPDLLQDQTGKPFYFGFTHLCINGKTEPVLKHAGYVTNLKNYL